MPDLSQPAGSVHARSFVKSGIYSRNGCEINDGAPACFSPNDLNDIHWPEPVGIQQEIHLGKAEIDQ
ncbi:hypothetical protein D3C73_1540130 [compost metagenome]